jgi:hypothetical protein
MNGNDELWNVLRESSGNYSVEVVIFLTAQEPQATATLFSLPNQPGRIDVNLSIASGFAIDEA